MGESIHNIPTLINQFIAAVGEDTPLSTTYSLQLSELIKSDELTLLQFIQNLGPTLTSENDLLRAKSLSCLSSTLEQLQKSKLSKQDINVLTDFLLSKIDDKICLQNVLIGVGLLVQFRNYVPSSNTEKILLKILHHYDPKKNLAKVRYEVFQILTNVLDYNEAFLVANPQTADLFVKTFIHVATGEKDPRNLLSSFRLNTRINQLFTFDTQNNESHTSFVDDLFDVCFCYFPISFTPPPNDPYKITADDLKLKLRLCIASQSKFAKDSFSSLIEKLTSTNPTIRNDTLKTLLACIESYETATVEEYWLTLWNSLKFEILHNDVSVFTSSSDSIIPDDYDTTINDSDDNKSLVLTLVIVQKLVEKLGDQQLDNFLQTVFNDLKENLIKAKDKAKQSVLLLAAVGSHSIETFNKIVGWVFDYEVWGKFINIDSSRRARTVEQKVPESDETTLETEISATSLDAAPETLTTAKQRDLIDNFGFIFISYQTLIQKLSQKSSPQYLEHFTSNNELTLYKDHLLIFMGQLLMTSSNLEKTLKSKTIQQLIKLIQIPYFLNENEISLILGYFNDIIDSTIETLGSTPNSAWEKDLVIGEIIAGSIKIMENNETLIIETILSNLLLHLDKGDQYEKVLTLIGNICVNHQILEILSIRLSNKLSYDTDPAVFLLTVDLFISLINKIQSKNQFLMNSWYKGFIPKVLKTLVGLKQTPNAYLIERTGDLVGIIIRFIESSKHEAILNDFLENFTDETLQMTDKTSETFGSFGAHPTKYISVFNKALANVDKAVIFAEEASVKPQLSNIIYSLESDEFLRIQYLQTLSIIVNKFSKWGPEETSSKLGYYYGKFVDSNDINAFEILIWSIKGLLLRTDRSGIEYLNKLVELLSGSSDVSTKLLISQSLTILFIDLSVFDNSQTTPSVNTKKLISKVSNLNVKLLYKQQVFELILPQLIENCEGNNHPEISLNALSLIIENISKKILISHLNEILPLVLKGVNVKDSSIVIKSSLSTLKIIIEENQSIIDPHLSAIIPNLLNLATQNLRANNVRINNEEIRILSLENLIEIYSRFTELTRYKASSLSGLKGALDDKKRSVRKLSSDLRQILFELN